MEHSECKNLAPPFTKDGEAPMADKDADEDADEFSAGGLLAPGDFDLPFSKEAAELLSNADIFMDTRE